MQDGCQSRWKEVCAWKASKVKSSMVTQMVKDFELETVQLYMKTLFSLL